MKNISFYLLLFFTLTIAAQTTPTPDVLWGPLFKDVQLTRALADNKTFVDMVPKYSPQAILKKYAQLSASDSASLYAFVLANFYLPPTPHVQVTPSLPLKEHLQQLWHTLTRNADIALPCSSLLPLPKSYIVPGGRFREIYYWDSYFTMQGLAVSRRYDLIESMVDNFKWLIDRYGHIPNGNRNYYLARSQPPFFALMVDLMARQKGKSVYEKYFSSMEKEYRFWMNGTEKLKKQQAYRRVVKMPDGSVLNRYYDDKNAPREESYAPDYYTAKEYALTDGMVYTNLRAGAESGWDFSSRWFRDTLHLNTIETTNLVPVDLNALLYAYEMILSKAAQAKQLTARANYYRTQAGQRKKAVLKYCWSNSLHYFFDYDFVRKHTTDRWSVAGVVPLFVALANPPQAAFVQYHIEEKFLKDGGVLTTLYHTGQQWDAPNGWAPLQFMTVRGLLNYGYKDLAQRIAERWMAVNEKVFQSTGKMLEKYNVEDIHLKGGGGEYPTQDGFGWTNGVYLAFYEMFKKNNK